MKQIILIRPSGEVERCDVPDGEMNGAAICKIIGRAPAECRCTKIGASNMLMIMAASGEWNALADSLLDHKASTYGDVIVVDSNLSGYKGIMPAIARAMAKALEDRKKDMDIGEYVCLEGMKETTFTRGRRYGYLHH